MSIKLLFMKIQLFFDDDMRNQLKNRKKFEDIVQKLTHKKLNLIKNMKSKESIDLQQEIRVIDMIIKKVKIKLKNEFDNKLAL